MKLFMFEHCWLCFRVRMTAALKQKHLQEVVVLDYAALRHHSSEHRVVRGIPSAFH